MRLLIIFVLELFLFSSAIADEATCPASRAAELDHKSLDVFHEVIAPLWHGSWPARDYDALMAAGSDLEKALVDINKLDPKIKNKSRLAAFEKHRSLLGEQVSAYVVAADKGDKDAVYKILPVLHEEFESAAAALIPISFPEIEGIYVTIDLILNKHLPANNKEGIVGSTETLFSRIVNLSEKSIPEQLADRKSELLGEFKKLKDLTAKMKESCGDHHLNDFRTHAVATYRRVVSIIETYL